MKYAVALDIGGTKIEGVLFDDKYRQVRKKRIYFPKKKSDSSVRLTRNDVLDMISALISELAAGKKITGIGISIPDTISPNGSIIGISKIKSLSNFNLADYLNKKFGCKVRVAHDAACLALGEQRMGAGTGYHRVVGVIFGTGIGSGLIIDGRYYMGSTGSCGEFGHNIVNPTGPSDRLGFKGSVEAYAGGPDLVRNYLRLGGKMADPDPKRIYTSKEKAAVRAKNDALLHLSIGLAQLMNILNPDIIILGGGQSNLPVYAALNRLTKRYTFGGLRKNVKIVRNKLGDSAGVYGAAALILRHQ